MKSSNFSFHQTIQNSRVLSEEQKQLLLDNPESFSDAFRSSVARDIAGFDARSQDRENYLRAQLEQAYQELEARLFNEGINEESRQVLLAQAREQINAFFPN